MLVDQDFRVTAREARVTGMSLWSDEGWALEWSESVKMFLQPRLKQCASKRQKRRTFSNAAVGIAKGRGVKK